MDGTVKNCANSTILSNTIMPIIPPTNVELTLKRSNAVAVGAFNIHIIQPNWLVKAGVLEQSPLGAIEFDVEQPGFRFQISKPANFKWLVRPDKLAIESFDRSGDPASYVSRVLEKLPHTPIVAIGINFMFAGPSGMTTGLKKLGFPQGYQHPEYKVSQRTWHVGLREKSEGGIFRNLQLADGDSTTEMTANFHYDISANSKNIEGVLGFLKQFTTFRTEASKLAMDVFGVIAK